MSTTQSTAQTKAETTTASANDLSRNQILPVESRTETQFAIRPTGAAQEEKKSDKEKTTDAKTETTKPQETKQGYSDELLKKIDEFKNSLSGNKDEIITILKEKYGQGVTEARMQKAVAKLDAEMKSNPGDDKWVKNALVWGGIALLEKIEEKYGEFTKKNFQKYLEDKAPKAEKKEPVKETTEKPAATTPNPTNTATPAPKTQPQNDTGRSVSSNTEVTGQTVAGDKNFLRVVDTGQKDAQGSRILSLQLWVDGKKTEEVRALSGLPGSDQYLTQEQKKSIKNKPAPDGVYTVGSQPVSSDLKEVSQFSDGKEFLSIEPYGWRLNGRSDLGIHGDPGFNDPANYEHGTHGCIGVEKENVKKVFGWVKQYGIHYLEVNIDR